MPGAVGRDGCDDFHVLGAAADPANATITIYVNRQASKATTIAWFVVN